MKRRTANSLTAWNDGMRDAMRRLREWSARADQRIEASEPAPFWAILGFSIFLIAGLLWVAAIVIGA